jgi:hypothetical protein
MACRTLLLKLEQLGHIQLPPARNTGGGNSIRLDRPVPHSTDAIDCPLKALGSLKVEIVQDRAMSRLFNHLMHTYHYLGFCGTVGENMKYLIFDSHQRPIACFLFGSAAWKAVDRDQWVGWPPHVRESRLSLLTNNMRFLILPWVRVPHLASHLLGKLGRRISDDWVDKYGHPLYLLETFVERDRFRGTCYQAANWIHVGSTQGRSRNDTNHMLQVPIKDVYLYPLISNVQEVLCDES